MLKPEKETFVNFWKMSRLFHMKILDSFLDCLCLDNFGWFTTTLPLLCPQYLASWPLDKLGNFLAQQRFANCSEEQIFLAVVSYCRTKSGQHSWDELAPGRTAAPVPKAAGAGATAIWRRLAPHSPDLISAGAELYRSPVPQKQPGP